MTGFSIKEIEGMIARCEAKTKLTPKTSWEKKVVADAKRRLEYWQGRLKIAKECGL